MRFFILVSLLFVINQILIRFGLFTAFTTSYLDDLLFFPVFLSFITIIERIRQPHYQIPVKHTIIGIILISLVFEVIFPQFDPRMTADPWDVLMYIAGAIVFHLQSFVKSRQFISEIKNHQSNFRVY